MSESKTPKNIPNLHDVLQKIYHEKVNLETTMTCQCTCCRVAMPQINYAEFLDIVTHLWETESHSKKAEIICTCIAYYLKQGYDKWKMESLIKPCVFHDKESNLCQQYERRPLNCRLYGLWPTEDYERRVDRFAEAYETFGVKREDLPLNQQCGGVHRVDESDPLTSELINELFAELDKLDKTTGGFSDLEIQEKNNYRTFHDWLLVTVFGEEWMSLLSNFLQVGSKELLEDQIEQLQKQVQKNFSKSVPELRIFKKNGNANKTETESS